MGKEGLKYCSEPCRKIAWNNYMRDRALETRMNQKLAEEAQKRMQWLVENQEFETDYVLDEECFICGKKCDKLYAHHVRYNPPIKKTLCRSCHDFLHHLLKKRTKAKHFKK
jgi:RNase P subunit RPR2